MNPVSGEYLSDFRVPIYKGLYIREATDEEFAKYKERFDQQFSGFLAMDPSSGAYYAIPILNNLAKKTPDAVFRINDRHTQLIFKNIHCCDRIYLQNNEAYGEIIDCPDEFV